MNTDSGASTYRPKVFQKVLGIPLHRLPHNLQVGLLSAIVLIVHSTFFLVAEGVFKSDGGFPYGGLFTWIEFLLNVLLSFGQRVLLGEHTSRTCPLWKHAQVGFFAVSGTALSNVALTYLNFPTWVLFKSSRVLAVMIGSAVMSRRRYSGGEWLSVLAMCVGLVIFSLGDLSVLPTFHLGGIILVSLSLVMNALHGNTQESVLHSNLASASELLMCSSMFGALFLLPYLVVSGELVGGCTVFLERPQVFAAIMFCHTIGFLGISCVLALIAVSDATLATIVTSIRKALTMTLSFVLFSKPVTFLYFVGALLVFGGTGAISWLRSMQGHVPQRGTSHNMRRSWEKVPEP